MPLDDRLCDGETEPRAAPEHFAFRPDRMEAVEDRLAFIRWHARPVILDPHNHLLAVAHRGDLNEPAGRREGNGIVDQILDRAGQSLSIAEQDGAAAMR